jgi:hypothetical protein
VVVVSPDLGPQFALAQGIFAAATVMLSLLWLTGRVRLALQSLWAVLKVAVSGGQTKELRISRLSGSNGAGHHPEDCLQSIYERAVVSTALSGRHFNLRCERASLQAGRTDSSTGILPLDHLELRRILALLVKAICDGKHQ